MKMEHQANLEINGEHVEITISTLPASKATGYIFDRFVYTDYSHLTFTLNLESKEEYESFGDLYPLNDFIRDCQTGVFLDYDGHSHEIVLDGKVVWSKGLGATDIAFYARKLKALNQEHDEKLQIAWYNK